MNSSGMEHEAKFWIADLPALRQRLENQGAELTQPRILESNWRFDQPDRSLSMRGQVLRLRQDTICRLTYKSPSEKTSSVSSRKEIEFEVSDQTSAWQFLETLGFECIALYEKYRSAYQFKNCEVSLDEMPFGTFSEIEGRNVNSIRAAARALNLRWEARTPLSYLALYSNLKSAFNLPFEQVTFENFKNRIFTASDVGLSPADLTPL